MILEKHLPLTKGVHLPLSKVTEEYESDLIILSNINANLLSHTHKANQPIYMNFS